ncbi:hypothetical protein GQX74_011102 [Glossina fuscipes]|nr:hypothetical protein GQX74_011102 [Glossina fuscipes]
MKERILKNEFKRTRGVIRVKCVQSSMHYLINQPDLRPDKSECLRARQHDSDENVRTEAISGLAFIYRQTLCDANDLSKEVKLSIGWIKNKVMHGYYTPTLEYRLTVECLLITCLIPYKLGPKERMKKLYHMLGTLDDNASKAFIELQKNQMKTRKTVLWFACYNSEKTSSSNGETSANDDDNAAIGGFSTCTSCNAFAALENGN